MNKVYLIHAKYFNNDDYEWHIYGEDTICAFDSLEKAKAFINNIEKLVDYIRKKISFATSDNEKSYIDIEEMDVQVSG